MPKKCIVQSFNSKLSQLANNHFNNIEYLNITCEVEHLSTDLYNSIDQASRIKLIELCNLYSKMLDMQPGYYYVQGFVDGFS